LVKNYIELFIGNEAGVAVLANGDLIPNLLDSIIGSACFVAHLVEEMKPIIF
jgi:hypothetical protein